MLSEKIRLYILIQRRTRRHVIFGRVLGSCSVVKLAHVVNYYYSSSSYFTYHPASLRQARAAHSPAIDVHILQNARSYMFYHVKSIYICCLTPCCMGVWSVAFQQRNDVNRVYIYIYVYQTGEGFFFSTEQDAINTSRSSPHAQPLFWAPTRIPYVVCLYSFDASKNTYNNSMAAVALNKKIAHNITIFKLLFGRFFSAIASDLLVSSCILY